MKEFLVSGVFAFVLLTTACGDKSVTADQLPEAVTTFIQQAFPGQTVLSAEKEQEMTGSKYDVVLSNGILVDFDTHNVWDKIEGTMNNPVPTALIPEPIVAHIQANFPDAMILKIDKENYGYEVGLANGLELKFNQQGVFTEMDD